MSSSKHADHEPNPLLYNSRTRFFLAVYCLPQWDGFDLQMAMFAGSIDIAFHPKRKTEISLVQLLNF
jgi:hypothetical protein